MIYLWATLLVVVNGFWLILTLLTLPGNWMIVATTVLFAWWQWDKRMFHPATLVAIVALAVVGEVLEFFSSAVGVKKAGGTRWGGVGSLLGAVIGAVAGTFIIPVPVLGTLIGTCLGACLGAWAFEALAGRTQAQSAKAGVGAGVSRLAGSLLKFAVGAVIWLIVAVAAFWP